MKILGALARIKEISRWALQVMHRNAVLRLFESVGKIWRVCIESMT
jgi:hypothetical protein